MIDNQDGIYQIRAIRGNYANTHNALNSTINSKKKRDAPTPLTAVRMRG